MQLATIKHLITIAALLACLFVNGQNRGCIPIQSEIVSPAGDTFCINPNGYFLAASPAGGVFTGANVTGSTFSANEPGTFTIIYFPQDNCYLPDTLVYTIKGPPATPGAIIGPIVACSQNGNIGYCVDTVAGATSYTWSVSPMPDVGTVTVNNECMVLDLNPVFMGDVCITVAAVNECGSSLFTNCFNLSVLPPVNVNANTSGIATMCEGSLPLVVTGSPQGGSYSPSNYIDTDTPGNYIFTYTVSGNNGCSGSDTDTVTVIANPVANFSYYNTSCNEVCFIDSSLYGTSYMWDYGDGVVGTSNCHTYPADFNGTYCVSLLVTNQCSQDTMTICGIVIACVGVEESVVDQLNLYPNPTNGLVNVSFTSTKAQSYVLNVVDVTGKVLYTENLNHFAGQYNNPIDLSRFASGMYIFRIVAEDGSAANIKLIRE